MFTFSMKIFFADNVDKSALQSLFNEYDGDKDGSINVDELEALLVKLGVAPLVDPAKRGSASKDTTKTDA